MSKKCFKASCVLAVMLSAGLVGAETGQPVDRLEEIVVTGTRTPHALKDVPVETILINRTDIELSNAQTIGDVLKTVPGINTSGIDDVFGDGTSRVRMQGLDFNNGYGLILIDGQRVHGSGQSGAHGEYAVGLNQIPVAMIERIEVVKGPGSVLYGSDALVGVINVITRKTPGEMLAGGSASYGWYTINDQVRDGVVTSTSDDGSRTLSEYSLYIGDRPHEKIGYLASYSYESGESVGQDPIDSDRHSLMAKADMSVSEVVDVWLKGEASVFEREGASPRTEDSYRISAGGTWTPSESQVLYVKGYHYIDDFDNISTASHQHGSIGYDQAEAQYTLYFNKWQAITVGAEVQQQGIDYLIDNSNGTRTTVKEDVVTWSLFAQDEITLFDSLTMIPGVRLDHHSTFGSSVNPKLSMMYRLTDSTTVRGAVGRAFKSPTIRQLYYDVPFYHSPFWIQSNPDLDPETSIGYSLGVEQWLLNDTLIVNLGLFRNDIDDMVVSEIADATFNGEELRIYRNIEQAMTQGVELTARLLLGDDFTLSASYTYTDSENQESGNELTYTPNHQITIAPAYEYAPWGLGGSALFSYNSRQYADTANTNEIDGHVTVDANIYKRLGSKGKLTFQADNIFDSDKGSEYYFRTGQTFIVKLDIAL
ncbi:MAG: TonB-dependent receptor [Desulfobulbaceae bacterium]|nr:TonB-dependent receptor [Desulfobulbaceae bacterium]